MRTTHTIAILAASLLLWAGASLPGRAQDTNRNFVVKTVYTSADSCDTLAVRRTVAYYDGLGRPVQTVRRKGSPDSLDLADRIEYDSLGRESRVWQAVRVNASDGFPVDSAAFVPAASGFYSDTAPFRETVYDGSPLDRIRKVTGPGQAWHQVGKGVTSGYLTNAGAAGGDSLQCVHYGFSLSGNTGIGFSRIGLWPAGSLTVDRTEDEDGRTLWVFRDMRDLTVLERRLAKAAGNTAAEYADTYYLYDDAGRLVAVLPPELSYRFADGNWSGSTGASPEVEGFAYQYRYDARGRMIAKKLPGAAWTYYVYDKGDRQVLTQDGNQRIRNEWSFRLQDALGRECLTGTLTGTYDPFADPLGNVHVCAVRDHGSGNYSWLHDYTVTGLSLPSEAKILTVNFWDDYSFLGRENAMYGKPVGYDQPLSADVTAPYSTLQAQGLMTGHLSATLQADDPSLPQGWVCETWFYDGRGNTVQHVKSYPAGTAVKEQCGYDFAGNLTDRVRAVTRGGNAFAMETLFYTYDSWGRLLSTRHKLNGGDTITLASNTYDAVGRLASATRGGTGNAPGPAALTSSYSYNVRDWLTGIGGSLFSETLMYETPRTNSLSGQWGGNVSGMTWSTDGVRTPHYDFSYDLLGRMTAATFGGVSGTIQPEYSRTYAYDLNGNMTSRRGKENSDQYGGAWLRWTWDSGDGNRPSAWHQQREIWPKPNPQGPSGPQQVADQGYAYDMAGNRTVVLDGQGDTLSVMRYNRLNLPEEYIAAEGDTVRYVYSADGEKLHVQHITAASDTTGTEYAANFRIENDTFTMIHTDAGYYTPVTPPGGAGGPSYMHVWYLKDHLGNNRVLADGSGNALKVYHYDPFGEQIFVASPPTFPSSSPSFPDGATESPYRYGGKEWSVPTSTYDFEARQFSPSFHRFTSMDPLAEKYYGISPYAYCKNNPINRVEVSGEWDVTIHVFQNRDEYGYGLAIVTNNSGDEVFRFTVRVEGVNGRDRYIVGADTPLGKYKIPNNRPWKSGGSRKSYGFPYRLNMEGVEGEIIDTGRSAIRIHGGRQEYFDEEIQLWIPFDSPSLVKTEGCVRAFDRDMLSFKTIVDGLEETNPKESPGFVTIVDDLVRKTKGSGNYVEAEEYYDVETPVTWQTIWQSFWENGYYYAK